MGYEERRGEMLLRWCIVSFLLAAAPHGEPDSPTTVESHCAILMQMGLNQLHGEIVLIGLPLLRFVSALPPEVGEQKVPLSRGGKPVIPLAAF